MATNVALALIATTLVVIALFTWSTIHYVPLVLYGDDAAEESPDAGGRPN